MVSTHAELSAQRKALPDVFTRETCVSDKCREDIPRQSHCKAGRMSSSRPCLAKCSAWIFWRTTEKLGFGDVYFHCETDTKHRGISKWELLKAGGPWERHALPQNPGATRGLHGGSRREFHWPSFSAEIGRLFLFPITLFSSFSLELYMRKAKRKHTRSHLIQDYPSRTWTQLERPFRPWKGILLHI